METVLPITKPWFDKREFELIYKPLEKGHPAFGAYVRDFEKRFSELHGNNFALAVNSGESGLFIMSRILDLRPGQEVIVPAFGGIHTANAVEFTGAKPVFCDINLDTFTIDTGKVRALANKKTRALYAVHMFGLCADMGELLKISQEKQLAIVEDCSGVVGARIGDIPCGLFGLAAVFSFHSRASIITGEGGMVLSPHEAVAAGVACLRENGSVSPNLAEDQPGRYLLPSHPLLGYNMMMTDLQGALGIAQSEKVLKAVRMKQRLAMEFGTMLQDIPCLRAPRVPANYTHGYQTYCTLFKAEEAEQAVRDKNQRKIDELHLECCAMMTKLEKKGVGVSQGGQAPPFQQVYAEKYGYKPMDFPAAYAADRLTVALPFFPKMTEDEKHFLFKSLHECQP